MIYIIKNFIPLTDLEKVQAYIKTIKFNTREEHVPLHDDLFEKNNIVFDLHTRGEMPDEILAIFSKYSKGYYEKVQAIESDKYHPPMFSKHYIARYRAGSSVGPHFDPDKPEGTYKSYIYWNDDFDGGMLNFPSAGESLLPAPGDLVFFIENEQNRYEVTEVKNGDLYMSEAWMGKVGKSWMPGVNYETTHWDDWEIKGF
jgi:hypothetical protein